MKYEIIDRIPKKQVREYDPSGIVMEHDYAYLVAVLEDGRLCIIAEVGEGCRFVSAINPPTIGLGVLDNA